jgi:protein subunit release factor B
MVMMMLFVRRYSCVGLQRVPNLLHVRGGFHVAGSTFDVVPHWSSNIRSYSISSLHANSNNDDLNPAIRAKDVVIPMDKIDFSFARSSGPGGQNVNKLNTKAEMRFNVNSANWLAVEVRQRLLQYNANKITKDGELYVSSQEHRTQAKNKSDCVTKLKELIAEAMLTPKEREIWVGLSEKTKKTRRDDKRKRGDVKNNRKKIKDFDF